MAAEYNFTRGPHPTISGAWDIDNPDRANSLAKEIEAQFAGKMFTVKMDGTSVTVCFDTSLTGPQVTALEGLVADHKANNP